MATRHVIWSIEVEVPESQSPEMDNLEAVLEALSIQRDPDSRATVFQVATDEQIKLIDAVIAAHSEQIDLDDYDFGDEDPLDDSVCDASSEDAKSMQRRGL